MYKITQPSKCIGLHSSVYKTFIRAPVNWEVSGVCQAWRQRAVGHRLQWPNTNTVVLCWLKPHC